MSTYLPAFFEIVLEIPNGGDISGMSRIVPDPYTQTFHRVNCFFKIFGSNIKESPFDSAYSVGNLQGYEYAESKGILKNLDLTYNL
jgi:hypothetical protein